MKTDKELLELAAKAVGVSGEYVEDYEPGDYYADRFYTGNKSGLLSGDWFAGTQYVWNPLESDGDALRLAVNLQLDIVTDHEDDTVSVWSHGMPDVNVKRGDDPCASTRRAIVKAAAAIGSKK